MTYCVAMRLKAGLVFLSDSRTNAGLDQISTFRKMTVFEKEGDRVMVLLAAGNLAITQAVRQVLQSETIEGQDGPISLWNATSMFDAARVVGAAVRRVHQRDAQALSANDIDFNVNLLFGGQIKGEEMRLFHVYSAGNFVETDPGGVCFFQIGESKYGKPIIDRVVTPDTPLDEAAKCALVSMDSTLKSNLSVGLPLDLLIYEADSLRADKLIHIDENNDYFRMIRSSWGKRLKEVFESIPAPSWADSKLDYAVPQSSAQQPQAGMAPALSPILKIRAPDA